jgi:hypothetical protein
MKETALNTQVGGSHYKDMVIQPVEFIEKNNLGFCVGNVIKYVCRYKSKNGIEDLKKAKHYLEILIDIENDKNNELESVEIPIEPADEEPPTDEVGPSEEANVRSVFDKLYDVINPNDTLVAGNPKDYNPTYEPELQEIEATKEELRHKPYEQKLK